MRIAVLSDIHANVYALEAVVRDFRKAGADRVLFLGDLIINGLYPAECFDLLKSLSPEVCIKGNTDAWLDELSSDWKPESERDELIYCRYRYILDRLSGTQMAEIRDYPFSAAVREEGADMYCCHGSPRSFSEMVTGDESPAVLDEVFQGVDQKTILLGHTHCRMQLEQGGRLIINPGAVGYSFDGDTRAAYGFLEISGGRVVFFRRNVEYNRERYLKDLKAADTGFSENVSAIISKGLPPESL